MPRSLRRFRPPFCPNPRCEFHRDPRTWRPVRWGSYPRQHPPRRVPRYRCSHCGRTFGSQTFATTYWLKRPALLAPVFDGLVNCTGLRQMARMYAAAPSTIQGLAERVGRHGVLFLQSQRPQSLPREPIVIDGFESFAFSQYHPLHVNVAVGAESHFLYAFTEAELRRKGRMTPAQRARREELEASRGRPDPRALERSVTALLELVAPGGGALTVRSDEHPAYPRAMRRVPGLQVRHERTSSKAARTTANPLFPVNRLDLLARHTGANHKRETIAYSKRLGAVAERFAVFAVWFNFQKSRSEKHRGPTPAQSLGLVDGPLSTRQILEERLFPSRVELPGWWRRIYERRVPTRALLSSRVHELTYAA